MAKTRIVEFEVTGSGAFPVDMLRYDGCYPASTEDALSIVRCRHDEDYRTIRTVRLITIVPPWSSHTTTPDRWQSFGWIVTKENVRNG